MAKKTKAELKLIKSGEVPPNYFDEKYTGGGSGRNQTEFQRHEQSRILEKWRSRPEYSDPVSGIEGGTQNYTPEQIKAMEEHEGRSLITRAELGDDLTPEEVKKATKQWTKDMDAQVEPVKKTKKRIKAKKDTPPKIDKRLPRIKQGFKGDTYGQRMYIEFIGNPEYTDPNVIAQIQENFIKKASDPKRANVTWVTRSQGFGKDKDQLYAKPTSGVHPQGAIGGKFGETHKVGTPEMHFPGVKSQQSIEVYVPDTKAAKAAYYAKKEAGNIYSKPKLMKPRSDLGAIIFDAASTYNRNLLKGITESYSGYTGDPSKMIKEEFAKGAIRVKPFVIDGAMINKFKKEGYNAKDAYIKAVEYRDNQIKALGNRKQVAMTRKGDFETTHEIKARKLYEGLQQARKDSGFKSKLASDKLIDEFIDEVNTEINGKYKYSWEFKEGARSFLENRELDWHKDFESASDLPPLMNEQRLEDTRMWGMHGKSGTTLTNFYGQDIALQGSGISGDYAYSQDYLAGGAYQDDVKGPVPITTSGEELGPPFTDPTITKTRSLKTKGGEWSWEDSKQATIWKGYPGQIYHSEQIETMKESQLIAKSAPAPIPGSIVTSSWSNIITGGETDEVKALIYGDFDDDLAGEQVVDTKRAETPETETPGSAAKGSGFQMEGDESGGFVFDQGSQIKMTQDMLSIEEAALIGNWGNVGGKKAGQVAQVTSGVNKGLTAESRISMRGASLITSATEGTEGQTLDESKIRPLKEIRTIIQASTPALAEIVGGANVSQEGDVDARLKVVGKKEQPPEYKPTRSEITRKQIFENLPDDVKAAKKRAYSPLRNQKIKEYNARIQAGTQAKFLADLKMSNRKNSLITSTMQGTAGTRVNPAEAILNPKAAQATAQAKDIQPKTSYTAPATVNKNKLIVGDLWEQEGYKVVSTNLGGVHGRGLAKQAQSQGLITPKNVSFVTSPKGSDVITLAVKGAAPETAKIPGKPFSEQTVGGNVKLMESEVNKLINFARKNPTKKINIPFIGLGFGEGDPKVIKPILARAAQEPNIYLISKDEATVAKYKSSFAPGVRRDSTSRKAIAPQPKTDIELKKSSILTKESGKPTFTTKGEKVKTAAKTGAKLLKGPGSTTLNALGTLALVSPFIGAFGAVVEEQKREEESQAAYPLHPPKQKSLWSRFADMDTKDFSQALMHRYLPEEIYGKEGYPSLKKVKDWKRKGGGSI